MGAMETRELYSGTARCGGIVLSAYPLKPWFGLSVWLEMIGLGSSVGAGEGRTAWFLPSKVSGVEQRRGSNRSSFHPPGAHGTRLRPPPSCAQSNWFGMAGTCGYRNIGGVLPRGIQHCRLVQSRDYWGTLAWPGVAIIRKWGTQGCVFFSRPTALARDDLRYPNDVGCRGCGICHPRVMTATDEGVYSLVGGSDLCGFLRRIGP